MADTTPKPFVFVLMPFEAAFDDIYQLGIKPAAEGGGAYCERIDEQIFADSILSRIYNQIAKADLIVADMTGRNPNVFYEVGYAHALGKTVILLTKNSDDIPFDLRHYPHIIYADSIVNLKDKLGRQIAHHLANPATEPRPELPPPDVSIAGTLIKPGACVEVPFDPYSSLDRQSVSVGIHNPNDTIVNWEDSSLALILPQEFPPAVYLGVQLPDKRFLYDLGSIGRLLPDAWKTVQIDLLVASIAHQVHQNIKAELTIFTGSGPRSTAFFFRFV